MGNEVATSPPVGIVRPGTISLNGYVVRSRPLEKNVWATDAMVFPALGRRRPRLAGAPRDHHTHGHNHRCREHAHRRLDGILITSRVLRRADVNDLVPENLHPFPQ